jgi:hypothetical protein
MVARRRIVVLLLAVALGAAGCANIPEQSTPQAVPNANAKPPVTAAQPDPDADPYQLVRDFIGAAGNPEAAKGYLADPKTWPGDAPPTIIAETFNATPVPAVERKGEGDTENNQVTVVLTVSKLGRLGADRAFIPAFGTDEFRVLVSRKDKADVWRIQTPPNVVLIRQSDFNLSYQQVSLYFFDPELRVIVPDLRYIVAQPTEGAPNQVIRLLLDGPSDTLDNAVKNMLAGADTRTNTVVDADDGAVEVNLTKIGEKTAEERQLIAAQVVLSLRGVTQARIRLLVDNHQLIADHTEWRPSDIPSYDAATKPNPDLAGLFTTPAGKVFSLADGAAIQGQVNDLKVASAAQSIDGKSLAVVQEVPTGARLRIGPLGGAMQEVQLAASTLTRPTWLLGTSNSAAGNEVWTVQNGKDIVRVLRTGNDTWAASTVNTSELGTFGTITDLRLSRDGVRIAAVISGLAVVASVVRTKDSVAIRSPRAVQSTEIKTAISVDWRNQENLVVATGDPNRPVVNVPVDGFKLVAYNSANLTAPVTAVAAGPDRDVVVTDSTGMLAAAETNQVWRSLRQVSGARPFYPG